MSVATAAAPEAAEVVGSIVEMGLVIIFSTTLFILVTAPLLLPGDSQSRNEGRLDTREKALNRAKRRYVDGDLTLEEYENRVHQLVDAGEEGSS